MDSSLPPDQLFLENLPLIEKLIEFHARRARFSREDAEDFSSWVKMKLMEDDYRVFREFEGRSSLKTYLSMVISRLSQDYRNHLWGKYHPSAEAKRLGPLAVRLEILRARDKLTFEEACKVLLENEKLDTSVAELEELDGRLPVRVGRINVGEESLQDAVAPESPPDQQALEGEQDAERRRICAALYRALKTLPDEDSLLVQMSLKHKIADIARLQQVEQKPLYRKLGKIHKALQKALEREGVRREDIQEIFRRLEPDRFARPKKTG